MSLYNRLKTTLNGGGLQDDENKKLLDEIEKLKEIIKQKDDVILEQTQIIDKKRTRNIVDVDVQAIKNIESYFKTQEYQDFLKNPEIFEYDESQTAFQKNNKKFYDYQKNFIESWSLSQQELVILYYGVGTGKTMIAINCAEQYVNINDNSFVYFLCPASIVFVFIKAMFINGIDPRRKNNKGEYIYNFVSYQQLLNSKFNFKDNSLLIVDEVHNLRNFRSKIISEKVSARKWEATQNYSLVGTKLGIALLEAKNKFVRSIFMSGTLFVNSEYDIEPIISIGYKKAPMTNFEIYSLKRINRDIEAMKLYYDSLISFYQRPNQAQNFPKVKYEFIPLYEEYPEFFDKDFYFLNSRTSTNSIKINWIVKFLKKRPKEKTLVYFQFLDKGVNKLISMLDTEKELKYKYMVISGELPKFQKQLIQNAYNNNEINILIFTLAIKEGISFRETNNFIYAQPYWNYAITEQIIARGIRSDSHAKGNNSTVNVYMLCGFTRDITKEDKKVISYMQNIMNNDIKTFNPKVIERKTDKMDDKKKINDDEDDVKFKMHDLDDYTELHQMFEKTSGRDANMYFRMFNKQREINKFELNLLNKVDRFEKANNIENNDFIKVFNASIIKIESDNNKLMTVKEKLNLKKDLYKNFYNKEIEKINKRVLRIDNDDRFKINRNPNLEEQLDKKEYKDLIPKIKKLINEGKSLKDILDIFNLSKQEITNFQANFTPESEVDILIEQSNIKNDKRNKLFILEPTAGIGNVINGLLKLPNKSSFNIDAVEIHSLFYQIGFSQFDNIDTIKYYNLDFLNYKQKYNYDYIIGNPPFNLRTQIKEYDDKKKEIIKKDVQLFDVNFVSLSYNMLNENGTLSMIISNRFQRDNNISTFKLFNLYLNMIKKNNNDNVKIIDIKNFKQDKTITEKMTTNYGMVCITLKKIPNFNIDLSKVPNLENKKEIKKEITKIQNKEKREIKKLQNKEK